MQKNYQQAVYIFGASGLSAWKRSEKEGGRGERSKTYGVGNQSGKCKMQSEVNLTEGGLVWQVQLKLEERTRISAYEKLFEGWKWRWSDTCLYGRSNELASRVTASCTCHIHSPPPPPSPPNLHLTIQSQLRLWKGQCYVPIGVTSIYLR